MDKNEIVGNQFSESADELVEQNQNIDIENMNGDVEMNDTANDDYSLFDMDDDLFEYDENLASDYDDYIQADNLNEETQDKTLQNANEAQNAQIVDMAANKNAILHTQSQTLQNEIEVADDNRPIKVKTISIQSQAARVNRFDLFFLKLWAAIVAGVGYCAEGVNYVVNLIFKRKLPLKYVKAFVAAVIILVLLILLILPFSSGNNGSSKQDGLQIFESNMAPVKIIASYDKDGLPVYKWGYVDKKKAVDNMAKESLKIPAIYEEALPFNKFDIAWARVKNDKGHYWELINKKGERIGKKVYYVNNSMPLSERPVGEFTDNKLCWVNDSGKFGYINTKGNIKIKFTYDVAGDFVDGIARVGRGNKQWFINTREKTITEYSEYDDALDFSCGLGAVKRGKWGFINKKGKEVINLQYDAVSQFVDGYALVKMGATFGVINTKGESIVGTLEYYDIYINNPIFKKFIEENSWE